MQKFSTIFKNQMILSCAAMSQTSDSGGTGSAHLLINFVLKIGVFFFHVIKCNLWL
jgi:hypothetical protein